MNLPLFHDPLQGTVTVDAPLRDPRIERDAAFVREPQAGAKPTSKTRHLGHGSARPRTAAPTRSARQRKVAEDLQALIARNMERH